MEKPVAKRGDRIIGLDTHIVLIPSPAGPVPTPLSMPFNGVLGEELSVTVFVEDQSVAIVGSVGTNSPGHLPIGGPFQRPPANRATVTTGSTSVLVEDKGIARSTDPARSCNDPSDADTANLIATSTVIAG